MRLVALDAAKKCHSLIARSSLVIRRTGPFHISEVFIRLFRFCYPMPDPCNHDTTPFEFDRPWYPSPGCH